MEALYINQGEYVNIYIICFGTELNISVDLTVMERDIDLETKKMVHDLQIVRVKENLS